MSCISGWTFVFKTSTGRHKLYIWQGDRLNLSLHRADQHSQRSFGQEDYAAAMEFLRGLDKIDWQDNEPF